MKGKLTIFLGYAPGVGKTYTMLKQAKADILEGLDVVAGYIEPHDRLETLAELKGLELLPYKISKTSNIETNEFDLDLAIKRKPNIILVDELAHTNPSDFENSKRYQDVLELLNHGIDVYTTVNIQHIESLNTIIYEQTNVEVKETIPDYVFDEADSIKIIDIDVDSLIERFSKGKVYKSDKVEKALTNFFKKSNLEILRKLALKKTYDKLSYNEESKETVLVCLSASPSNPKVLRTAKKISDAFHGELYSLYVDLGNDDSKDIILKHKKLASDLGAKNKTVYGDNLADEIINYANSINATKIVIGKTAKQGRFGIYKKDLVDKLNEKLETDIYVIPNNTIYKKKNNISLKFDFKLIILAFISLLATTLIAYLFSLLKLNDIVIILTYVLGIIIFSLSKIKYLGSLIYTAISMLLFNFFFTEPKFTFMMKEPTYPLMLLFVFIMSLIIIVLNNRVRSNSIKALNASKRLQVLLDASLTMSNNTSFDDSIETFFKLAEKTLDLDVAYYDDKLYKYTNLLEFNDDHELGVASVCLNKGIPTGKYTINLPASKYTYYPVKDNFCNIHGVIGINHRQNRQFSNYEESIFMSYLSFLAQKIASIKAYNLIKETEINFENEKFKSTLLRSISHDLKTPLTGISGNAELLLKDNLDKSVLEKVESIYDEANWLKDMVNNILSITRFSDEKTLKLEPYPINDIINSCLEHVNKEIKNRSFKLIQEDSMLFTNCEPHLLQQALLNVLNNAIEHTKKDDFIKVIVKEVNESVVITIENNGEKIDEVTHNHLFDLFYSTKQSDSKRGSGLGLYITKSIINMHSGDISHILGETTIFEIVLPSYKMEVKFDV